MEVKNIPFRNVNGDKKAKQQFLIKSSAPEDPIWTCRLQRAESWKEERRISRKRSEEPRRARYYSGRGAEEARIYPDEVEV